MILFLVVSPALAQEAPPPAPPPPKTFDVFEVPEEEPEDELPEGDAPAELEEEPVGGEEPIEEEPLEEVDAIEPDPIEEAKPVEPPPQIEPPPQVEPPPSAPPPPRGPRLLVLLIGEAEDANLAQRIGDEATRHLAALRSVEAMSALEALDPTAEQTKREEIQLGRKSVDDGLLAFEELDLVVAGEKLETAVNALAGYFGELPEPARYALAQAIFASAATTLFEGLSDQADSVFVALALLDPKFVPEEGRYPSNVVDRFESVKSTLTDRTTGSLTVKTNPSGAAVFIDGVFRGSSPVTVSSLADGYHVVSVRRIGFRPLGTLTPVNGENSATVDLELVLSKDTSRLAALDRELFRDPERAAQLAKTIGAEAIAVLDLARRLSGTVVEGVFVKSDGTLIARVPPVDVVEEPEIAGRVVAEAIQRAEQEKVALATAPPPVSKTPLYEEWWFWAAIGGAVAAVATSAAVAAAAGGDGPPRSTAIFGF